MQSAQTDSDYMRMQAVFTRFRMFGTMPGDVEANSKCTLRIRCSFEQAIGDHQIQIQRGQVKRKLDVNRRLHEQIARNPRHFPSSWRFWTTTLDLASPAHQKTDRREVLQ